MWRAKARPRLWPNPREVRDQAAAARFIQDGKHLLFQGNFDGAIVSFQAAQRLHKSSEVDGLITRALQESAAQKQKVAEDKTHRAQAEAAAAAHNRELQQRKAAQEKQVAAAAEMARQKQHSSSSPASPPVASAARPAPLPAPPPPANVAALYAKQLQLAQALEKQQKYDDAVNAYAAALKLKPGDVDSTVGLHMARGRKALAGGKFPEAAREFEETLRISPKNAEAARALQQARQGRR